MEHKSNETMVEALKLLEEAAKQKKDELKTALTDKYSNLRNLILESEGSLLKSLATAKEQALEMATDARKAGVEKVLETARDVDSGVHQNPWPYIAGSAVIGLLLGCILGRSSK